MQLLAELGSVKTASLRKGTRDFILDLMSTGELLKQVKALPRRQRQKVFKAILELEENEQAHLPMRMKRVKWPDVEARAKRIFGTRVLPNLVLLDREDETFWAR